MDEKNLRRLLRTVAKHHIECCYHCSSENLEPILTELGALAESDDGWYEIIPPWLEVPEKVIDD